MENETSYIEKLIKNISSDKTRLISAIFGILSLICSLMYVASTNPSATHMIFMFAMIVSSATVILYSVDTESKIKHADTCVVFGIGAMILALFLKIIKVGISFSVIYLAGYSIYAISALMLGLYFTKEQTKPKIAKILLILCTAWSVFEFFNLSNPYIKGIAWKIFRLSEAFLSVAYIFMLNLSEKNENPIAKKAGNYKKQIPSFKICVAIIMIISIVSGIIGFVMNIGNGTVSTVTTQTVTQEKQSPPKSTVEPVTEEKPKKSTVTSTVIPAEEPEEISEIKLGDTIETDSFTLKLNKVEISHRVEPSNPPSYYTYYQAEPEHTYIYVNASVTNKEKHAIECDEIYSVTADFDGGYEYKGFNIADDSDGDFTYANITSVEPLATLGVHCLVDCPQIVEEEGKPLFITINLNNGSRYKYIIK